MRFVSHAVWSLVGTLACLGSVVNAAGELEIGVVFPRNETYAPTDNFPIVFALQNAELAKHLRLHITSMIRNGPDLRSGFGSGWFDLADINFTTEPYLVYKYVTADTDGPHQLFAYTDWLSCDKSGNKVSFISGGTNYTVNFGVDFTIQKGAQEVDLVAATANDTTCSGQVGFTLNVTDETHEADASGRMPGGTCAVLASPNPTPTVGPCRVKIDTAAEASMSAVRRAKLCKGINPPDDCPEEESAVQRLAISGVVSFAAMLGAVRFVLA